MSIVGGGGEWGISGWAVTRFDLRWGCGRVGGVFYGGMETRRSVMMGRGEGGEGGREEGGLGEGL